MNKKLLENEKNEIIKKLKSKYHDKYDYSLIKNYVSKHQKVKIICLKHGIFEQNLSYHLIKEQCPECKKEKRIKKKQEQFIEKARKIYHDKYDYFLVEYKNSRSLVKIICLKHGIFEKRIGRFLNGDECCKCKEEKRKKNKKKRIIKELNEIHKEYDYSLLKLNESKIKIICPKHGIFEQNIRYHLSEKRKCPKCEKEKSFEKKIENAKKIHNNKYDYSLVDISIYPNAKIICPKHGIFEQKMYYHSLGSQCPKCANTTSKLENEIFDFIKENYNDEIISKDRQQIKLELDIYIPKLKLAFEYNGLYWHSEEQTLDKNYHLNKTELCEEKGIHLIHIYEDDWVHKQEIVKSRILNLLGKTERKIYARKCIIKELDSKIAKQFLNENHLQGSINSRIKLGLYYKDELVSVMTFGSLRKSLGTKSKEGSYELLRFCNKLNTNVIGGAGKLYKYFLRVYSPKYITSYADRSWTPSNKDNLYLNLGMKFIGKTDINYYYVNLKEQKKEYRFKYRKDILVKQGYNPNKTEHEIMLERKIYRIYNSGNLKYKYNL